MLRLGRRYGTRTPREAVRASQHREGNACKYACGYTDGKDPSPWPGPRTHEARLALSPGPFRIKDVWIFLNMVWTCWYPWAVATGEDAGSSVPAAPGDRCKLLDSYVWYDFKKDGGEEGLRRLLSLTWNELSPLHAWFFSLAIGHGSSPVMT